MSALTDRLYEGAVRLLEQAKRLVVLTGAGMSQESGIPTFRDAQTGMWARFRPEALATESAFRDDPSRVFSWYLQRLKMVRAAHPNPGHESLVAMESRFESLIIATQNVDSLHSRAGSANVLELHGSLERFYCADCGETVSTDEVLAAVRRGGEKLVSPVVCRSCGGLSRPGVVWFGESLPEEPMREAWEAARNCDVMLIVGTSAQVYPVAELPHVAWEAGASLIEINPDETPVSGSCACTIRDSAATGLQRLVMLLPPHEMD